MKLVEEVKVAEWVIFCFLEFAPEVGTHRIWEGSGILAYPGPDFFTESAVLGQSLGFRQYQIGLFIFQVYQTILNIFDK